MTNKFLEKWISKETKYLSQPNVDCTACSQAQVEPLYRERWQKWKCCTFQPFIPNYSLGSLIESGNDSRIWIETDKFHLSPLGLFSTSHFRRLHALHSDSLMTHEQLCGFYSEDQRQCTIWNERPGECSTYYCTQDQEKVARLELAQQLLNVEATLAQLALVELKFPLPQIDLMVEAMNGDNEITRETNKEVQSEPIGEVTNPIQLREIYLECWRFARDLTPEDERVRTYFDIPSKRS